MEVLANTIQVELYF